MRRCIWRRGAPLQQRPADRKTARRFKHLETFEIGGSVFVGPQAFIQGGSAATIISNSVWIGPQAYGRT